MKAILFIEQHIELLIAVASILFAWFIYCKNVKAKTIEKLSKQVIAYYCLEEEAISEIKSHTNENEKTIKMRLREKAQKNNDNFEREYPSMTAKQSRNYL